MRLNKQILETCNNNFDTGFRVSRDRTTELLYIEGTLLHDPTVGTGLFRLDGSASAMTSEDAVDGLQVGEVLIKKGSTEIRRQLYTPAITSLAIHSPHEYVSDEFRICIEHGDSYFKICREAARLRQGEVDFSLSFTYKCVKSSPILCKAVFTFTEDYWYIQTYLDGEMDMGYVSDTYTAKYPYIINNQKHYDKLFGVV